MSRPLRFGIPLLVLTALGAASAHAQAVQVAPFVGYRFGGDFYELATGRAVDADGAPSAGVLVDVRLPDGLHLEGLFSHQNARFVTSDLFGAQREWDVVVDHWQGGALQELRGGRVRPFLSGLVGLTRYGIPSDNEVRFAAAAGGGVTLLPSRHVGVRLDGRVYGTFLNIGGRAVGCGQTPCLVALDVDVVWQAEFTAGVVVRIP